MEEFKIISEPILYLDQLEERWSHIPVHEIYSCIASKYLHPYRFISSERMDNGKIKRVLVEESMSYEGEYDGPFYASIRDSVFILSEVEKIEEIYPSYRKNNCHYNNIYESKIDLIKLLKSQIDEARTELVKAHERIYALELDSFSKFDDEYVNNLQNKIGEQSKIIEELKNTGNINQNNKTEVNGVIDLVAHLRQEGQSDKDIAEYLFIKLKLSNPQIGILLRRGSDIKGGDAYTKYAQRLRGKG